MTLFAAFAEHLCPVKANSFSLPRPQSRAPLKDPSIHRHRHRNRIARWQLVLQIRDPAVKLCFSIRGNIYVYMRLLQLEEEIVDVVASFLPISSDAASLACSSRAHWQVRDQ